MLLDELHGLTHEQWIALGSVVEELARTSIDQRLSGDGQCQLADLVAAQGV